MAKRRTRTSPDNASEEVVAPLVPIGALAVALLDLVALNKPLIHMVRETYRQEAIAAILRALAPDRSVAIYPEWDCLPFDRTSPSRGVMGQRTGVLRWLTDTAAPARHRPDDRPRTDPAGSTARDMGGRPSRDPRRR